MPETPTPPVDKSQLIGGEPSVELASSRTAMSLDRTHLSTDRTLMSVIRTSLSLISFGFTIFQFFHSLLNKTAGVIPTHAPRRFSLALIILGVLMLITGLFNHMQAAKELRQRRQRLYDLGLLRHVERVRVTSTTLIAVLLLVVGLLAIASMIFHVGPFE